MQSAEDNVDAGVYCSGGLQDFFDAGVGAAVDEQEAVGLFDGEGEFRHFEEAFALRDGGHEKDSGRDFGEFIDEDEISGVIEFPEIESVGIGAIEVAHFGGKRSVGAEVRGRDGRAAKTVGAIAGNVHGNRGVDFEDVFEAGGVIGVAMRDDHEIEFGEIDAEGFDVVLENVGVVTGIEKNAFAVVFDERGEAPIFGDEFGIAEGVVEDGDAIG